MSSFKLIKTNPDDTNFALFTNIPEQLYPKNSPRFQLGHDPVLSNLDACYVLLQNDQTVGRFAFYENPNLKWNGVKTACIGSYECLNNLTVSNHLIKATTNIAKKKGYAQLIGPMDGSTWNNHRFSTDNDHTNFFMEPYHHTYYNDQFLKAGLQVIANYESNLVEKISFDAVKYNQINESLLQKGAVIRCINIDELESELSKIATFCNEAFQDNFCFTPIEINVFVEQYIRLKDLIIPELIWLLEDEKGKLEAISFSIRDYNDSTGKRFIIKTLARRKESDFKGIGTYLTEKTYKHAIELSFENAIHAFMKTDNFSTSLSSSFAGKAYKNYALYGIQLKNKSL